MCASDRQTEIYRGREQTHRNVGQLSSALATNLCTPLEMFANCCHCVCVCMRQQQFVQIFAKLMLYFIIRFSNLIPQKNKEINHVEIANNIEEVEPGSLSGELLTEN